MMKRLLVLLLISSISFNSYANPQPLKQEGKKSLYQRVLSSPDCKIMDNIKSKNEKEIPAFSRFYVYGRKKIELDQEEYLEVGSDDQGTIDGYLKSSCAIPWNMQMALTFNNPSNRNRLLFFKDKNDLEDIVNSEDRAEKATKIYKELEKNNKAEGILAQEPELYVDWQRNFYLLPILSGEEIMNEMGGRERILEIASVSKKETNIEEENTAENLKNFKAGVVFVIDSTISMQPYIDSTKKAMQKIYNEIEKNNLQDKVKFGLVAFRSDIKVNPELEYITRMYVNPNQSDKNFLVNLKNLQAATVSSQKFDEDSYAGIYHALNEINWKEFGGRYIILITDAGAINANDERSSTGLGAEEIRLEAQRLGVAIYTLHLQTPAGKNNFDSAKIQYEYLSFNNAIQKPLYYKINATNTTDFDTKVLALSNLLTQQVKQASQGEFTIGRELQESSYNNSLEDDTKRLDYAMKIAYLGSKKGEKAPNIFRSWITDTDLINTSTPSSEVRILMTKNQLSELSELVQNITDAAIKGLINSSDMFDQLRSVAVSMGQDPNKLKEEGLSIAKMGLMAEYLEDLPYKSEIMGMDEDTWSSKSAAEQDKFIMTLNRKLRYYRKYNANVDLWIPLHPKAKSDDFVFPVPIEALP